MDADCYSCLSMAGVNRISPGPTIYEGEDWLVEHAYPTRLPGWLVLVLKRHAENLHDLTAQEFSELGRLLDLTVQVLHEAMDCEREYAACFAEAPHFHHVHFHVVPVPRDSPDFPRGSRVFDLLKPREDGGGIAPTDEIARLCLRLRDGFAGRTR